MLLIKKIKFLQAWSLVSVILIPGRLEVRRIMKSGKSRLRRKKGRGEERKQSKVKAKGSQYRVVVWKA